MILYKDVEDELKHAIEMYENNYNELVGFIKRKDSDNDGFYYIDTVFTGNSPGSLSIDDLSWINNLANPFRRILETKSKSSGYYPIKKSLLQIFNEEDSDSKEKIDALFITLKLMEKRHWNYVAIPLEYDGMILTAHHIIDITHNQYIFHDGTSNGPRDKTQKKMLDSFRKDYPNSNPLIINYLSVLHARLLCIGVLKLIIEEFQRNKLLTLELRDDISLDQKLDTKVTLFFLNDKIS